MNINTYYVVGMLSFLFGSLCQAEEPGFEWNRQVIDLIASGDVARGEALAKKHKCAKCHGDTGISEDDDTPSIAGQTSAYQFKQLVDYKSGERDEKSMRKRARKLTREEMADISAFYAAQEPEQHQPTVEAPKLATEGDEAQFLIACDGCHGKMGKGFGMESPRLNGQTYEYFVTTMNEFRQGERVNDHNFRMRLVASRLSEEDIEALADYYARPMSEE